MGLFVVLLFGALKLILVGASDFQATDDELVKVLSSSSRSGITISSDLSAAILEPPSLVRAESSDSSLGSLKVDWTPKSQVSSLSSSSPEVLKFIQYDSEEHFRPRGSSFHTMHPSKKGTHVSYGFTQYSDDTWMPTTDMEDNCENREHIRDAMLASARHGNLEYFRCLKAVLDRFNFDNPHAPESLNINHDLHELDSYNPSSMIFAAAQGDNVELFEEVMAWKGITFKDLDPCAVVEDQTDEYYVGPSSFPPKGRSILDDESSSSEDEEDNALLPIDDTVFGRVITSNSLEIFKLLLAHGITDKYPEESETALHLAIKWKHEMIVRLLIDHHGDSQVNRINGALQSPLMAAIAVDCPKIVKLLLDCGASIVYTDFYSKTVLHYAAASKKKTLETLIVLRDALTCALSPSDRVSLVMAQDIKLNTAAHLAADLDAFRFLVNELGADPTIRNGQRELPKFRELMLQNSFEIVKHDHDCLVDV